ncbi:MAG TPA: hypothetical protein PLD54_03420 [Candidatus Levybacteria bacterium]|nr:hypothetical protein [Candidatus Levybacteria bacterium]
MDIHHLLLLGHLVGIALGVGGATISDIFFFRSLRDGVISKDEFATFQLLSKIVMTGFALLFISGFGFVVLHVVNTGSFAGLAGKVIAKAVIVLIILINSQVLHHKVMPLLKNNIGNTIQPILEKHSVLILTSGAISGVSWYTTLLLGSWRGLSTPYEIILLLYTIVVSSAIIGANIVGFKRLKYIYLKKNTSSPSTQ